jgi:hypothetical protein
MIVNYLKYWIAPKSIDGAENLSSKNLVDDFGHPKEASLKSLKAVPELAQESNPPDIDCCQQFRSNLIAFCCTDESTQIHSATIDSPLVPSMCSRELTFISYLLVSQFLIFSS